MKALQKKRILEIVLAVAIVVIAFALGIVRLNAFALISAGVLLGLYLKTKINKK